MGRDLTMSQNMSLDGVMQSPGYTDVPFKYKARAVDFDHGTESDRFQLEQAQEAPGRSSSAGSPTRRSEHLAHRRRVDFADRLDRAAGIRRLVGR